MRAFRAGVVCLLVGVGVLCACSRREAASPETALPDTPLRILVVGDPFGMALEKAHHALEDLREDRITIEVVGYGDMRRLALLNHRDRESSYDIISYDSVWVTEFEDLGLLHPIPDSQTRDIRASFLPGALELSQRDGHTLGLPIQPHAELLWYRRDMLEAAGIAPPVTTDDLLTVARTFHDPDNNRYGICWNAQRGQPLGQTMCHFFGAFGQPLLNAQGRPDFRTEKGLAAARYALALLAYSPPDILSMAWDQRTARFASGQAVMTYGWGARAYMAEDDPSSRVAGKVAYIPPPHAPGVPAVTPMGGWSLGIPSNLDPDRTARAEAYLLWLLSPEPQRLLVRQGNGAPPLLQLTADPDLQALYPVLGTMLNLVETDQLNWNIRPPIPQWDAVCEVLGTVFYEMLSGRLSPEDALAEAQHQTNTLF